MNARPTVFWPAESDPLVALFGTSVTATRRGETAIWRYRGQSVSVSFVAGGVVEASFAEHPVPDQVSKVECEAIYRATSRYALNEGGSSQMVDDMIAFFSGVRAPRFRFAALRPIESAA